MTLSEVFTSLAFALICMGTQAIMQTLGRITSLMRPGWYQRKGFRAFVAAQNLLWGVLLAHAVELPKLAKGERVLVGLVGGFISLGVYELVLKRFEITAVKPKEHAPPDHVTPAME